MNSNDLNRYISLPDYDEYAKEVSFYQNETLKDLFLSRFPSHSSLLILSEFNDIITSNITGDLIMAMETKLSKYINIDKISNFNNSDLSLEFKFNMYLNLARDLIEFSMYCLTNDLTYDELINISMKFLEERLDNVTYFDFVKLSDKMYSLVVDETDN